MSVESNILDADLSTASPNALRGHLDVVDARTGISGWVVNLGSPGTPVTVALHVGKERVARVTTSLPRPDIALPTAPSAAPGFHFGVQEIQSLLAFARARPSAPLSVRVAGTSGELRAVNPMPTVSEFLNSAADPTGLPMPLSRLLARDLPAALTELRRAAVPMAARPLPGVRDRVSGFIEAVATETSGLVWFIGWMHDSEEFALSGVIVDRVKYPAAMAYACFPRGDLPEGAQGVMGVMMTDWRSRDPHDVAMLHFGEGASLHLRSNAPLVHLSTAEWAARFDELRAELTGPLVGELRRLLGLTSSWATGNAGALGVTIEQGVDRILVLPGFGAFVEGWVLSPVRRPEAAMLRLGDKVLHADPATSFNRSRADLAGVLPGGASLAAQAGFVAAFPGDIHPDDMVRPIIKHVFADGVSTNHEIDARALRVLGYSAGLQEILSLYPDPSSEPFFPALAAALAAELRPGLRDLTPVRVAPSPRALIVALPDDASEIHLAFSELTAMLRRDQLPGVAVLAVPGANRPLVISLFSAMERRRDAPCSLFFLLQPENSPYVLPEVLEQLGAERFAFLAPGLHADPAAMAEIGRALRTPGPVPGFALPIVSGSEVGSSAGDSSCEAFVADCAEVQAALDALPVRLRGSASGMLRLPLPLETRKGRLSRSWGSPPDPTTQAVNKALARQEVSL
ncbi:hypothetical protein [Sabulicella glaciei]|uniref:Cellulose biosynthesis protein BcsE n=1 Tax=Sabulicella glaciei TaxID=2984948 RepID=A0ABT3NSG1_9PROT|nr:hypothetical protein [Roseococcus sp. MDT2-1-1]MCW8085099.1 hypothetical protein [Roseococcus sp. MDT2-1-1]